MADDLPDAPWASAPADLPDAPWATAPVEGKAALVAEGRKRVQESMKAPREYIEVPVYDAMGNATGATEKVMKPSLADPIGRGALSMVPFGGDLAMIGKGQMPGSDEYAQEKERALGEEEAAKAAYPTPYKVGQAGSLTAQMYALRGLPLPGAAWGTKALPEAATLGQRAAALAQRTAGGAAGGATVGGITGLGEGTGMDRLKGAAIGTAAGGVLGGATVPLAEGIGAAAGAVYDKFGRPLIDRARAAMSSEGARNVAMEKVAGTLGEGMGMTHPEFQAAITAGEPAMIGDVGTQTTRNLARTAANISPEAQQTLETPLRSRYQTQADRVRSDLETYLPDNPDYAATIENLQSDAREANRPAYNRAYAQGSSGVFNEELYALAQAPQVRKAMQEANEIAKNQSAYGETKGNIVSPFDFDKSGNLIARPGMSASDANLAYWDMVQRRLKGPITGLKQTDLDAANRLKDLHGNLLTALDDAVPAFKTARQSAAEGFGATDAYEAGIKFSKVTDPKKLSELKALIPGFSAPEQELFQRGYLFDKLGKIDRTKDNTNIINQAFMGSSPVERGKIASALDPEAAAALETRLRSEEAYDQLNKAVTSGSTTARQQMQKDIMQYGIATGAGTAIGGLEDQKTLGGVAGMLLKAGKGRVDARIANEVAKVLISRDPAILSKLMQMAGREPQVVQLLRTVQNQPGVIKQIADQMKSSGFDYSKVRGVAAGLEGAPDQSTEAPPLTIHRGQQ